MSKKSDWERYTTAAIEELTEKNINDFKDATLLLNDIGDQSNNQITYYFTIGRHHNIEINVMCHKPAQIDNTCRPSADTIHITIYNNAAFFQILRKNYGSKFDFSEVCDKVLSAETTQEILSTKSEREDIVANHGTLHRFNSLIFNLVL